MMVILYHKTLYGEDEDYKDGGQQRVSFGWRLVFYFYFFVLNMDLLCQEEAFHHSEVLEEDCNL